MMIMIDDDDDADDDGGGGGDGKCVLQMLWLSLAHALVVMLFAAQFFTAKFCFSLTRTRVCACCAPKGL